jgi:hypothetical protein
MHRAKASKSCQLFGVPYLFHALCFFALRVESTGALEGVARFGFDARLTLHILGRRSLALSFLTDHRHTGMLTFWSPAIGPGLPVVGPCTVPRQPSKFQGPKTGIS